jgi:hypothetical protein
MWGPRRLTTLWTPMACYRDSFTYFFIIYSGVKLSPLGTAVTTGLLYQPQMIDVGDCGEIGGMKIERGNLSTRRKPAPAPLCPPQIPHDQTRARTQLYFTFSIRNMSFLPHYSLSTISPPFKTRDLDLLPSSGFYSAGSVRKTRSQSLDPWCLQHL